MKYDLLKDRISVWLDKYPKLLPILYGLMDKLFLRTWYVHRSLRRINPQFGSKLLDAGTGFGQYAWHTLHKYPGVHVTATDLKKDYLDRGARSFDAFGLSDRVTWKVDDLTAPNLKELFDYILAVDVLEHIVEDEMAIAHFAKLLNRGGYLIISTPSDQGGSDVHDSTQESFIGEHVRDGYNLQLRYLGIRRLEVTDKIAYLTSWQIHLFHTTCDAILPTCTSAWTSSKFR